MKRKQHKASLDAVLFVWNSALGTQTTFKKQWRRRNSCSVGSLSFIVTIGFDLPRKTAHQFSQAISKLSGNRGEAEKQFPKS